MSFLIRVVDALFSLMNLAILLRVLLSWLPGLDPRHPLVRLLDDLTEPILAPIRRVLPLAGPIDFSPLVAMLLLGLVQRMVTVLLLRLAWGW
ncbi:MAG TPA: YggT family protein [Firmicutes bacterium]|nr:YggT family protein [Bacillota bacterium]